MYAGGLREAIGLVPSLRRDDGMAFALARPTPLLWRRRAAPRSLQHQNTRSQLRRRMPPRNSAMPSAPTMPDRASFTETWSVFALRVPAKLCNGTRKALKAHALCMPRVQSVLKATDKEQPSGRPEAMDVLLRYFAEKPTSSFRVPPRGNTDEIFVKCPSSAVAAHLGSAQVPAKVPAEVICFIRKISETDILQRDVRVGYEQWTCEEVLRNLLPDGVTIPSSFETVGHIAHLNLRDEHIGYKSIIGAAMLDKLKPRIRTVVNKLQSTGGPYRTFAMEVLAGDRNLETTLRENGCSFRLDFSKVYWNSRLETEHRRIIRSLKPGDVLADAFCGIGPFAIPAAKQKRCRQVYANDLNPSSVEYLRQNAVLNSISDESFTWSCSCAREFLKRLIQEEKVPVTRVVMNFPSGGPEFLDTFIGLYRGRTDDPPLPIVHCYGFVKGLDDFNSARLRARQALFGSDAEETETRKILSDADIDVKDIRDVAPRKRQVCLTFRVPREVAYSETPMEGSKSQPPLKRLKATA